jgi:hypothetical protein
MQKTVIRVVTASAIVVLLAAGCGDDGGSGDGDGDLAAYCALSAELDANDDFPSDEDLDRIKELAPSEISSQVTELVDIFKEQGEAAFDNQTEEFVATGQAIDAFEAENCDEADAEPEAEAEE